MDTAVRDSDYDRRHRDGAAPHSGAAAGAVAGLDFRADHFALFGLPQRFELDTEALSQSWRRLQALVHPDRFAAAGASQARMAMQWSTLLNTAYRTLLDPLQRAAYLCELRGAPIDAERNTAMPVHFLHEQMQWREQLDEAREQGDARALEQLGAQVEQRRVAVLAELARELDAAPQPLVDAARRAAEQVRVLMFIDKFRRDLAPRGARRASGASGPQA